MTQASSTYKIPATPVVMQMSMLTSHPLCSYARKGVESVLYETRRHQFEITANEGYLPRSCDVPVFWTLLGMVQAGRFDDPTADTVNVVINDILDALERKRLTANRKSVVEAIERYEAMGVHVINKRPQNGLIVRHKFSFWSATFYGDKAVEVVFNKKYLKILNGLEAKERRYMALDHVIRLSGFASQLYGLLLGPLSRRENRYEIQARTLARKMFGESRGGDKKKLPGSKFYNPYILDALNEIYDKTRWAINCEKAGRGEGTTLTFSTMTLPEEYVEMQIETAPNAWAIKRHLHKADNKTRVEKLRIPANEKAKPSKADKAETVEAELPAAVVAILNDVKKIGTGIEKLLAPVIKKHGEDGAAALVRYAVNKRKDSTLYGYIKGMGNGAMDVAEERGPSEAKIRANLEMRLNYEIKGILEKQIANGEGREWLEAECKKSDIAIETVDTWIADNREWVASKESERQAGEEKKRKAKLKEKELAEFADKYPEIGMKAIDTFAYDSLCHFGGRMTIDDIREFCEKYDFTPEMVMEYIAIKYD